jgi:thioredoxin reductase (NADPH)
LTAINGRERVTSVSVVSERSGHAGDLPVDFVLIRIGVQPNSELVRGQLELDFNGYVVVDAQCRTSVDRVYAVGDVANPVAPTILSAAGTGATAAKAVDRSRQ